MEGRVIRAPQRLRAVQLVRSILIIPANRTELAPKGLAAGADALIFDLEDAVAADDKETAREQLAEFLAGPPVSSIPIFVRVNGLESSLVLADLRAIVGPQLTGVLVPKSEAPQDIAVIDRVLGWLETDADVRLGSVVILPILETAAGARRAHDIALASSRTAYMGGLGVRGGDVERSLGYRWSLAGDESFAMRSNVLIDVRAADVPNPVSGMWADIKDLNGLRAFARQNRGLGYEGMMCIHPSHVSVINEEFSPTAEELDRDRRLMDAMSSAAAESHGATVFEGEMIDEATSITARRRLARFGLATSSTRSR